MWDALDIQVPKARDCISYLKSWAVAKKEPVEIGMPLQLTYMALSRLVDGTSNAVKKEISKLPVWTGTKWEESRPIYYSESTIFSDSLRHSGVRVWQSPEALHDLGDLPLVLGLEKVGVESFTVEGYLDAHGVLDSAVKDHFERSVALMRGLVATWFHAVYSYIDDDTWALLEAAEIELVPALTLVGKVGAKKISIETALFFSREEATFYFEHPSQIGRSDGGGALIAEAFDVKLEDRLQLSLAWVDSWQRSGAGEDAAHFPHVGRKPGYIDGDIVPDGPPSDAGMVATKRSKKSKRQGRSAGKRELVAVDSMQPHKLSEAAETQPAGGVDMTPDNAALGKPKNGRKRDDTRERPKQAKAYDSYERETRGLECLSSVLQEKGISIRDTRAEPVGADAIGSDGRYYELKVHVGKASGPLLLQDSQVIKAREMGEMYVLVVVENVEAKKSKPRITLIPDPLSVLQVHPRGRIEITGYDDDAFEKWELVNK